MYEPTWSSVGTHALPRWYDDAKLGVFLHWGPYSVPGWAPRVDGIDQLLRVEGPRHLLRNSPYAEWYLNTMQLEGSPTQRHHREVYGASYPYDRFATEFDDRSAAADLDQLAGLCQRAGAGYVVLTTKHHDGFCLWPTAQRHPAKGAYHARRDLVGDLTAAVRARGLRMGLYYSGGYDWPFNDAVIATAADALLAVPDTPAYLAYATAHVDELIERYEPAVLWNDIGWPAGGNLAALFARYYERVPDGVVNDRWREATVRRTPVTEALVRGGGALVERLWRFLPDRNKQLVFAPPPHCDVRTAEYAAASTSREEKWEATRGVGHSFGANRNEGPEDILSASELVRLFVDTVAKNGNLLIGVGPDADGIVPPEQQAPLLGLGGWLATNADAVIGTRPWEVAEGATSDGTEVRFTRRDDRTYALLLAAPGMSRFELRRVDAAAVTAVRLLGIGSDDVRWEVEDRQLRVTLPERLPVSPVHALELVGSPRPARG